MFMPFAFLLLLLTVPLAGGRLSRLSGLHVRGVPFICGALGLQIAMTTLVQAPHAVLIALHAASYAVIAWVIWLNRAVPGLLLIALGGGTNAGVIALNGGTLPARPEALAAAGFSVEPEVYKNSGVVADPVLPWLGDIMSTPAFLPFRNVISIGDLVVLLGGAVLLHVTCRTRLAALADRRSSVATSEAVERALEPAAGPAVAPQPTGA